MSKASDTPTFSQFACVGTGFSAIGLGATLKRWYGIGDIKFFERHSDLGGTWFINQYPGCACDIPSALYSFSFESNPDWSRVLPPQQELWQYLHDVAEKYSLIEKMRFGVNVEQCVWSEERKRWRMNIRHYETNQVFAHECQFLFAATGQLMQPREIDVPGSASFKGRIFHSSRWDQTLDIQDKKVVVIGNGCTASQIVPAIVGKTKHLTQAIRTKHWILPPVDNENTEFMKNVLRHVPGTQTLQRFLVFAAAENTLRGFYMTNDGNKYRKRARANAEKYMKTTAPAKYHDKLVPDFELGCKRRIFDSGYLKSLHSENLTLIDEPIQEIVPEGIRTREGVTEADVIVLANGFVTNNAVGGLDVIGRNGEQIDQHWESFGGPEAYNCTIASGFPNFFVLLGPNSLTGHASTIIAAENSINFALRIIKPVLDGKGMTVEVTREAEQQYVNQMQADMQKTVWSTGCTSWYLKDTTDGKKWNGSTYPYSQAYFWYRCLFPDFGDLEIRGPTHAGRRRRTWPKKLAVAAVVGYALSLLFGLTRNPLARNRYWQQFSVGMQLLRALLMMKLANLRRRVGMV
ncbi:dimethylaniline monooxygenase [Colletotrichum scovillei]|uniref:Dimethylaniline monooxygenase n=1 Tax=Colletotrichum scovillei TaxID=1209932 RepID=A0A9P7RAM6_9PEZI|nr:dimethylaniline monooxygenase [Colletotrichum scovillei]KAG7071423.1 dimethylaniline monooxygenase [Colletotrichum scovillei]KAG7079698.1 dimethylaniline monooxygenase [Colletotrichum scovillei]